MDSWKKYFVITGCNRFIMPGVGEINADNENMSVDKLLKAYQKKCPYVGLTEAGIKKYDPDKKAIKVQKLETKIEDSEINTFNFIPATKIEPDKKSSRTKREKPE